MDKFESRRDRFEFFETFENPLLNITFKLETVDFVERCTRRSVPPFHFFLYCVHRALMEIENFRYRVIRKEVVLLEELFGSYTVLNANGVFNFTKFDPHPELGEFVKRSLAAKVEAENSPLLINCGRDLPEEEAKKFVFMTCLPWLEFTSIQHPQFKAKSMDIPSLAWGKFINTTKGTIEIPFSVQAHHGFVDGIHMFELGEKIKEIIAGESRSF